MTLGDVAAEFNRYNTASSSSRATPRTCASAAASSAQNVEGFARLAHEGFGLEVRREGNRIVLSGD